MDNRLAWSICLCDDFIDIHVPSRAHIPFLLPVPIRFYCCISDGECAVERDLGRLTAEDQEHGGKLSAPELSDVMVINERGPRAHAELQVESDAGPLPTETTNEWVTEWRLVHGARVGCSPSAAASAAPRSKKVVFKTIVARVLAAGRSASRKEKSPAANNHGETCFGRRRSCFAASAQGSEEWRTSSLWTAKHDKFQDDTNKQNEREWRVDGKATNTPEMVATCCRSAVCSAGPPSGRRDARVFRWSVGGVRTKVTCEQNRGGRRRLPHGRFSRDVRLGSVV